jgi:hypothetical protein
LRVEGFFEVFATVAIAYLFVRLGVLTIRTATKATLLSSIIFLFGGIIGTFHHLYFTGLPSSVLALGAVFSALEIVPLCLVGFEAWENIRIARGTTAKWPSTYKWPIYFFVAVAFWNLVGAGLFGFLINPPVALYYMQGLNLTPVHGHTALFGVYGMLGIGLMLFTLRAHKPWRPSITAPGTHAPRSSCRLRGCKTSAGSAPSATPPSPSARWRWPGSSSASHCRRRSRRSRSRSAIRSRCIDRSTPPGPRAARATGPGGVDDISSLLPAGG